MTHAQANGNPLPANLRNANMTATAMKAFFWGLGRVSPTLGGKLAYNLWFSPRRKQSQSQRRAFLYSADKSIKFDVAGKQVCAWTWGEGPSVLLVHGWEGRATQFQPLTQALLEKGFRVVLFDLPAHGDSEGKQTDAEEIRLAIMALERLTGPFHSAITHSFGAVPLGWAVRNGLELQHAVMINPPARFKAMLHIFQKALAIPERAMKNMMGRIESRIPHLGERIWNAIDTEANAAEFDFPGMVVHDRDDAIVPVSQGKLIAQSWPGSELHLTSGLGHSRILKDPQTINTVVRHVSAAMPVAD